MGYRHQVMSDTMVPSFDRLPNWLTEKYQNIIDFNRGFWASTTEYKRYGLLKDLEVDIQKALKEMEYTDSIALIFYADESDDREPDLTIARINQNHITEYESVGEWRVK